MKMKYVLFDCNVVAIFSDVIQHTSIQAFGFTPISAGFLYFTEKGIQTFGESLSLGLKSRPEDGDIIAKILNEEKY